MKQQVAAVTLGRDILAQGFNSGPRDDLCADRRLDRDLVHLARDEFFHSLCQCPAAVLRDIAVYDNRKCIDTFTVDKYIKLDQRRLLEANKMIIEGGISAADRFQPIEEIQHDLAHGKLIAEGHLVAQILQALLDAALFNAQGDDRSEIILGYQDTGLDDRLADLLDLVDGRQAGRVVDLPGLKILQICVLWESQTSC